MDINLDFFQGNLRDNTRKEIAKQGFKSVDDFARAHEIDKSTLSRMINANREPRLSTLLRLSLALGVTIDELCGAGLPQPKSKGVAKPAAKAAAAKAAVKKAVKKAVSK
jgi:transcriptional regulator with XRE-family HTH domain